MPTFVSTLFLKSFASQEPSTRNTADGYCFLKPRKKAPALHAERPSRKARVIKTKDPPVTRRHVFLSPRTTRRVCHQKESVLRSSDRYRNETAAAPCFGISTDNAESHISNSVTNSSFRSPLLRR